MKSRDLNTWVGLLLILSISLTGLAGFIQARLELRNFFPHRYLAYTTLSLTVLHITLNRKRLISFFKQLAGMQEKG